MTNRIENLLLLLAASNQRIEVLQKQKYGKHNPVDFSLMVEEQDSLRRDKKSFLTALDSEFNETITKARDWGDVSGLPDMVLDIASRAAGCRYTPSRGVFVKIPVSPLLSFGKLSLEAVDAATEVSNASAIDVLFWIHRLDIIFGTLNALLSQCWAERKHASPIL